ncbi:unnamed protein product [Euphydryas editha]|uniref:Uncharacterized protein n=1 Tax=Euphydryas editha TaxID=104508 RepID=A0AAU9TC57_EUPED|nr:unnamed protein product [Euphydryas editha]
MEESNKRYNLRPLPGGRRGTPGAGAGCHSMRTTGGGGLNRRVPPEQSTTADPIRCPNFPSLYSTPTSPPYRTEMPSRSPTSSPMSEDVVQEAYAAQPAPTPGITSARKRWNSEMNEFIWRNYLILTKNETNTRSYLDTLHQKFIAAFPEMDVSRQRIGDQRRAIINNKLLPQSTLDGIRNEISTLIQTGNIETSQTNLTQSTGTRMRWSNELNESILRTYFEVTHIETDMTANRKKLHTKTGTGLY